MVASHSPTGTAGAVVDLPVNSPVNEDVLTELDAVDGPGNQAANEHNGQDDWPYSYLVWKAALEKIANTKAKTQ